MTSRPSSPATLPGLEGEEAAQVEQAPGEGWAVVLFNDDHNEMLYVALLLRQATGFSLDQCRDIMMTAHTMGKAIVTVTEKPRAERIVSVLTTGGLTAKLRAL